MNSGQLIAFEGIDGAGKTTQLRFVASRLRRAGRSVVVTREPTGGPTGQRLRRLLTAAERIPPEEELRWFFADRSEHVSQVVGPALARGDAVLTDRYTLSTAAYQGARGLDPEAILCRAEARFPLPDVALLLTLDPADGLRRVATRGDPAAPAFEEARYLDAVARAFANLERGYIARLDARGTTAEVEEAVLGALRERLPELGL